MILKGTNACIFLGFLGHGVPSPKLIIYLCMQRVVLTYSSAPHKNVWHFILFLDVPVACVQRFSENTYLRDRVKNVGNQKLCSVVVYNAFSNVPALLFYHFFFFLRH